LYINFTFCCNFRKIPGCTSCKPTLL